MPSFQKSLNQKSLVGLAPSTR